VHALHQVALDLTDTEEIQVGTNGTARVLKAVLIRLLADEKTGERFNVCTSTRVGDATQPVTKGIARAAARRADGAGVTQASERARRPHLQRALR
jgi:hypothetical protein